MNHELILILDFGSQVSKLIARRLREMGYYCELVPYSTSFERLQAKAPKGLILSGGPSSVYDEKAPTVNVKTLLQIAPIMGICYGMQLIAKSFGGLVESAEHREYGAQNVNWLKTGRSQKVWMSHGDVVKVPPPGFEIVARSEVGHPAALKGRNIFAVQFHPEVEHTENGREILKYFLEEMCHVKNTWKCENVLEHLKQTVQAQVPEGENILCALSGGVDSTVVGTLLTQIFGSERVQCVFVDTGLLRHNEYEDVLELYKDKGLNVKSVDAEELFFARLQGVTDPEQKRKIIGHTFIDVFKDEIKKLKNIHWLAQGTLYPDVIESVSTTGASVTIKSHHNVGGLPKDLGLKLLEPLKELFKDEVRELGSHLGLPNEILYRHPFPGPGLAVRIIGDVTQEKVNLLRACDKIFIEELKKYNLYHKIWQAFTVLLPIHTVGVQGDGRSYDQVVALRAVTSTDGMTADWYDFSSDFLKIVSNRITNQVKGINRVVYDITSKPPGTIEWE